MTIASRTAISLERRAVVRRILDGREDGTIVVAGLGSPCWDLASAGDHPLNFYLNGGMGSAAAIGLGLALAQSAHRVVVVTGDGELLMALGMLATIGVAAPKNLAIVVLDNERYLETGGQPTHTGRGVDLAAVALACGIVEARTIYSQAELDAEVPRIRSANGPVVSVVKITAERPPLVLPPLEATYTKHRIRKRLTGKP
ncbi:MAG: aldehyde dehydrogenase [Candidatus Eremiobacteraeota bacterium]|nr:aldehyde dehydrogenase [Candidatus Eremiobacteraeota bacterium]